MGFHFLSIFGRIFLWSQIFQVLVFVFFCATTVKKKIKISKWHVWSDAANFAQQCAQVSQTDVFFFFYFIHLEITSGANIPCSLTMQLI